MPLLKINAAQSFVPLPVRQVGFVPMHSLNTTIHVISDDGEETLGAFYRAV